MWIYILSKLLSESFLSLYPVFVKNINLPIVFQLWSRFFSYIVICSLFINYDYIFKNLFSINGLLLSLITTIHIYTSYRGFQLLESGIAYTIFYLYPLIILLFSGEKIHPILFLAIFGVYLLVAGAKPPNLEIKTGENKDTTLSIKNDTIIGIIMIIGAAITEAAIFFAIKRLKTNNHWNHLFISYFFGAIIFSLYFIFSVKGNHLVSNVNTSLLSISLVINAVLGLLGYLLRFYAISNLSAQVYAPLSYFGIFMSYVYGVLINGDKINLTKIIGTILILIPNLFLLYKKI